MTSLYKDPTLNVGDLVTLKPERAMYWWRSYRMVGTISRIYTDDWDCDRATVRWIDSYDGFSVGSPPIEKLVRVQYIKPPGCITEMEFLKDIVLRLYTLTGLRSNELAEPIVVLDWQLYFDISNVHNTEYARQRGWI